MYAPRPLRCVTGRVNEIDYEDLEDGAIPPPYIPIIDNPTDTSNFDSYEEEPGEIWAHYLTEKSDRFFEAFGGRLYTAPSSLKQMRSSGNTLRGGGGDRKDSNASQSHVPAEF